MPTITKDEMVTRMGDALKEANDLAAKHGFTKSADIGEALRFFMERRGLKVMPMTAREQNSFTLNHEI